MKRILLALMMFICSSLSAQDNITPIVYSEVIQVENVLANELFVRARTWFAKAYNNSKFVLQMAENNVLIGKAVYALNIRPGGWSSADISISYILTIECRDGRYKYRIDNIVVTPASVGWGKFGLLTDDAEIAKTGMGKKQRNEVWRLSKQAFEIYQMELIMSLKASMMAEDVGASPGDDW